jgi:Protein of unknown function (DUF4019)
VTKWRLTVSVQWNCAVFIAIASGIASVGAAVAQGTSSNTSSEISVTNDSVPGWLPSERQRRDVIKSANDYLSGLDEGRYDGAYVMMSELNKRGMPFEQFVRQSQSFHARSGSLKQRNFLKVTWTKDSAAAPLPGVYAAIDIASRYGNIDRHCGYVVLYQKSENDSFQVMRQESNFIDNVMAQKIEQQKSRAELDKIWARLAANCPNYDAGSSKPQ